MRIRMRTIAAGATWRAQADEIVDRPQAEAESLIAGGYAEAAPLAPAAPAAADPKPANQDKPTDAPKKDPPKEDQPDWRKAGDEAFEAALALGMSKEEAACEAILASSKFPNSPYFKSPAATALAAAVSEEPVNGSEAVRGAGVGTGDDGRAEGASES